MTNRKLLKKTIRDRGYMLSFIADRMGVCRQTLYSRLNGRSEFTDKEIDIISRTLRLTREEHARIFWL